MHQQTCFRDPSSDDRLQRKQGGQGLHRKCLSEREKEKERKTAALVLSNPASISHACAVVVSAPSPLTLMILLSSLPPSPPLTLSLALSCGREQRCSSRASDISGITRSDSTESAPSLPVSLSAGAGAGGGGGGTASPMTPATTSTGSTAGGAALAASPAPPELMLGLSFNSTTGHMQVTVIKGANLCTPSTRMPDTYVKLTLVSSSGSELARRKSSVRRTHQNPLFKEVFVFQVNDGENSGKHETSFLSPSPFRSCCLACESDWDDGMSRQEKESRRQVARQEGYSKVAGMHEAATERKSRGAKSPAKEHYVSPLVRHPVCVCLSVSVCVCSRRRHEKREAQAAAAAAAR